MKGWIFVDITLEHLHETAEKIVNNIREADSSVGLESINKSMNSSDSPMVLAQRNMGSLPHEQRAEFGKVLNSVKKRIKEELQAAHERILIVEQNRKLQAEKVDITFPTMRYDRGALHPIRQIMREVEQIFLALGWEIKQGPEIEAEFYNFDALNFSPDHPARTLQDTFFVAPQDSRIVLRTHTSPVQIRTLLMQSPPVYMICPGRVFRSDDLDATHSPIFTQVEGLAIDKHLTLAHLKGVLEFFAQQLFEADTKIRLRPHYFPFTEPSLEVDIWFENKHGGSGWIEWGGCGMVHPHVLISAGVDPDEYQGFAFGMGLERTVMLRNKISDIRDMVEGDVRFTEPFGLGW